MSFYPWDRLAGRSPMDYLNSQYGRMNRLGISALSPMDRISSLRDDFAYRPYAGGANPYVQRIAPQVDDFVSSARSASSAQPVYENRAGYRNFDHFDDGPQQRPGPRRDNRQGNIRSQPQPQRKGVLGSSNKDLKDTTPKKVLKRPAAAGKGSNHQSLSDYLKQMGSDEPVIGLKHITEYPTANKGTFSYTCNMCKFTGNASKMGDHITSSAHRRNYIKEHKLEEVADKDLAKRAAAIETVHGRGEWSVSKEVAEEEADGFVRMDKSRFFKKVKKAGDVDMQDLTTDDGDDKAGSDGLKKGDVVIDEFTIEDDDPNAPDPDTNPKFFVLKQIDKLLDDDFSIANETEAMVVDSIIRKMDRCLAQFVELANAESGIDDIQLLDKDDNVLMEETAVAADAAKETNGETTAKAEAVPVTTAAPADPVLIDVSESESVSESAAAANTTAVPAKAE